MSADRVLALDVGTQSVRAMVFDPAGNLLARAKVAIEPYVPGPPGCCEQDAELYWRAIGEACRQLWAMPEGRRDAIAGVALTTQRGTVVVTDETGRPLRRAMIWLDRCRAEGLPRIGGRWGLAFRVARATETVAMFTAEAEANVIRTREPEIWSRVRRYLLLSGFLTHRLTGRVRGLGRLAGRLPAVRLQGPALGEGRRLEVAGRARSIPPGCRSSCRRAAPRETISRRGRGRHRHPRGPAADRRRRRQGVRGPGLRARWTRTSAPSRWAPPPRSTPPTVDYVRGHPDRAAVPRGRARRVQPRGQRLPRLLDDRVVQARVRRRRGGARRRRWAWRPRRCSTSWSRPRPPARWASSCSRTGRPASGSRARRRRARSIGWGDVHTRAHLYRAILEGLAYALREGAERTVRRTKVPIRELRVSGGGQPEPGGGPAHRGHLRHAGLAAAHARDVRPRGGDRRGRRPGPAPVVRGGGGRDDPDRRDARPGPGRPARPLRGPVPGRLPEAVRAPQAAVRGDPADHRATRPGRDSGPPRRWRTTARDR